MILISISFWVGIVVMLLFGVIVVNVLTRCDVCVSVYAGDRQNHARHLSVGENTQ